MQAGCIRQYDDFTGAQDVAGQGEVIDVLTGDGSGDVSPADVPGGGDADVPPKDTIDTIEPEITIDTLEPPTDTPTDTPMDTLADTIEPADTLDTEDIKCTEETALACDDGNPCTDDSCLEGEGCQNNPVTDKAEPACDDGNPCTENVCVSGECKNPLKDIEELVIEDCLCDEDDDCDLLEDDDLCNGTLVCDTGAEPPTCMVDGETVVSCTLPVDTAPECNLPVCIPETGSCTVGYFNDDGPCSDGDACTQGEQCHEGLCKNGGPVTCDDGNPCTDDSCTTGVGCEYVPGNEGGLCESGLGVCVQGACCVPDCGGMECGDDGCGGSCGTCDDGNPCQNGQCVVNWTDPTSDLTWQVTPTGGHMNWSDAKAHCAGLSLDGGGWHLPTIGELRTLIRGCPATEDGGSCNVEEGDCLAGSCRDDSCDGCSYGEGPADGCYWPDEMQGICTWYWSSSPVEDVGCPAWIVNFIVGYVYNYDAFYDIYVRCVR